MDNTKNSGITQLNYIMSILTMFENGKPELSVTEIAQETGLSKGAVSRNLQAMAIWDLVDQNPKTKRFSLGMKLFQLGSSVNKVKLLCERSHPVLEKLAKTTGKTVGLMVRQGCVAISIYQVDPDIWPLFSPSIGREIPLFAGSSPKILLAYCPKTTQDEFINSLKVEDSFHDSKIDVDNLRKKLVEIQKTGVSISQGEVDPGIMSISVPVWGSGNEPIAALAVLWAEFGSPKSKIKEIILLAKKASSEISKKMGY